MKTTLSYLKPSFLFALVAVFFTGTGLLHAGTAGIQDNAGFFSEAAKADAKANIADAQRKLHKDIEVETLAAMPDEVKKANPQDKATVAKAYEQWVNKRGAELGVNGVYILLVKDPAHLQVAVGNDTAKQAFTFAERDTLVKMMLEKLRAKDYDGALRQGVSYIVSTMRQQEPKRTAAATTTTPAGGWTSTPTHSTTTTTTPSSSGGFSWVGIIIVLVILFIGFRIVAWIFHAIFGGGNRGGMSGGGMPMGGQMGGGYGGGYGGGGGGGFMRSMFGGILGAAAGSWIYDSFFGSHGSSAYGAPPQDYNAGDQGYSGQDTSFSSSGSDFSSSDSGSNSGGGGSFDSGSSGGGDFGGGGGGDFGGGGDSGGGGGDSGGGGGGDF